MLKEYYAHIEIPPPTEEMAHAGYQREEALAPNLQKVKYFLRFNVFINRPVIAELPAADSINFNNLLLYLEGTKHNPR